MNGLAAGDKIRYKTEILERERKGVIIFRERKNLRRNKEVSGKMTYTVRGPRVNRPQEFVPG